MLSKDSAVARTKRLIQHMKSPITSHVLDTSLGKPAFDIPIQLEYLQHAEREEWIQVGQDRTNADGRALHLMNSERSLQKGIYRLHFDTRKYFQENHPMSKSFYPWVTITFQLEAIDEHYHVPLLLNPFGYSTYRGS